MFRNIALMFLATPIAGAGRLKQACTRLSGEIGPNDLRLRNPARLESAIVKKG